MEPKVTLKLDKIENIKIPTRYIDNGYVFIFNMDGGAIPSFLYSDNFSPIGKTVNDYFWSHPCSGSIKIINLYKNEIFMITNLQDYYDYVKKEELK
jgi:hypothetical protein